MYEETDSHVADVFLKDWVIPNAIPSYLLIYSGPQFVPKFFASVCAYLGVKQLTTTAYNLQTNGQTERYNKTVVDTLWNYVAEHEYDWDEFVHYLTFAYNTQIHWICVL